MLNLAKPEVEVRRLASELMPVQSGKSRQLFRDQIRYVGGKRHRKPCMPNH
jgi:hypothetical protein